VREGHYHRGKLSPPGILIERKASERNFATNFYDESEGSVKVFVAPLQKKIGKRKTKNEKKSKRKTKKKI